MKLQHHFEGVLLLHDEKVLFFLLFFLIPLSPQDLKQPSFIGLECVIGLTDLNWSIMTVAAKQKLLIASKESKFLISFYDNLKKKFHLGLGGKEEEDNNDDRGAR